MSFIYPEVIAQLSLSCTRYRAKEISLNRYKSDIWQASSQVVALEERDFRKFLQRAEAELDSIEHTTEDEKIFEATLDVVRRIESKISLMKDA